MKNTVKTYGDFKELDDDIVVSCHESISIFERISERNRLIDKIRRRNDAALNRIPEKISKFKTGDIVQVASRQNKHYRVTGYVMNNSIGRDKILFKLENYDTSGLLIYKGVFAGGKTGKYREVYIGIDSNLKLITNSEGAYD